MREYHPTNIQKALGVFGKFGVIIQAETLEFNVAELPSSRNEILIDIVTVSVDGQTASATHDVDIKGSLNDGVTYSLIDTMTTGALTPGGPSGSENYKERQILTIPWTPKFQLQMQDYATKQALFYVSVLV
jgi:hypothetical protein